MVWSLVAVLQGHGLETPQAFLRIRLVHPDGVVVPDTVEALLAAAVRYEIGRNELFTVLQGRQITVSIVRELKSGIAAAASPADHVIILALPEIVEWSGEKLARVLRHELAHLVLSDVVDDADVPLWFREGYAEWAAEGLTCEGEVRIAVDLMLRGDANHGARRLAGAVGEATSRASYDYYVAFFDYLDDAFEHVLSRGRLLSAIRESGVYAGFAAVVGRELVDVVAEWSSYLEREYAEIPGERDCTLRDVG